MIGLMERKKEGWMDMVAWMVPLWTFVNELRRLLNGTSVRCGGVWLDGSSEITWLLETAVCGVAKRSVGLLITFVFSNGCNSNHSALIWLVTG